MSHRSIRSAFLWVFLAVIFKQAKSGPIQQKIELVGRYSWVLLFDIDNSNNTGSQIRKEEIKSSLVVNYNNLLRDVQEKSLSLHANAEVGAKLEVVSVSVTQGFESKISSLYEKTTEEKTERREERTRTDEFTVGPHGRLTLYRLVFNGPGIYYETDTVSSTRHPIEDVTIEAKVQYVRYLKDIMVVYTKDKVSKPADSIEDIKGLNSDINAGFGGDFVWLVPVWTSVASEGATSVELITQSDENKKYSDLAKGTGGDFRYLKMIRNPITKTRIVDVKLYRTGSRSSKPTEFGFDFYTADINAGRRGDYLYLSWKNVSI